MRRAIFRLFEILDELFFASRCLSDEIIARQRKKPFAQYCATTVPPISESKPYVECVIPAHASIRITYNSQMLLRTRINCHSRIRYQHSGATTLNDYQRRPPRVHGHCKYSRSSKNSGSSPSFLDNQKIVLESKKEIKTSRKLAVPKL